MTAHDKSKECPRGKCEECGRPLVAVGFARKGGRAHPDWGTRKLHKRCWLKLKREEERSVWRPFGRLN